MNTDPEHKTVRRQKGVAAGFPTILFMLGSACGGAAVALGFVCAFGLPLGGATAAHVNMIAFILAGIPILGLACSMLMRAGRLEEGPCSCRE